MVSPLQFACSPELAAELQRHGVADAFVFGNLDEEYLEDVVPASDVVIQNCKFCSKPRLPKIVSSDIALDTSAVTKMLGKRRRPICARNVPSELTLAPLVVTRTTVRCNAKILMGISFLWEAFCSFGKWGDLWEGNLDTSAARQRAYDVFSNEWSNSQVFEDTLPL